MMTSWRAGWILIQGKESTNRVKTFLEREIRNGSIKVEDFKRRRRIYVTTKEVEITHFSFTDDMIIFNMDQLGSRRTNMRRCSLCLSYSGHRGLVSFSRSRSGAIDVDCSWFGGT
ncbi:hypothetical protein F2Q69_00052319 [Brassica cretica]|uniref:Uncharacterized protein n=1 Tax=Brassica cretica TaxID=69181 RepID=A0A8S9MQA5_BRACR|nr:hypothetical protein F2Q69_00052319 [Brassica cretica]